MGLLFIERSLFLSTPSARRATAAVLVAAPYPGISIHALREEGDSCHEVTVSTSMNFYPRPPRGGRPVPMNYQSGFQRFLSTPSARRATNCENHNG